MYARGLRTASIALAALLTAAFLTPEATAAPIGTAATAATPTRDDTRSQRQTFEVTSTAQGLIAPATARPGAATFRVSTTDPQGGYVGLARLHDGASLATFRDGLRKVFADEKEAVIEGSAAIAATANLLGGNLTRPDSPASFTQELRPGSYLIFEYLDFEGRPGRPAGEERIRTLTVSGEPATGPQWPGATIVSRTDDEGAPRFTAPPTLCGRQPIRLVNTMAGQVNEFVFYKLHPGRTDADVRAYFVAVNNGDWNAPAPFSTESGFGSPPLSTGQSSVVQLPLTPGRYAVVTWVKRATDAERLAAHGAHTVVTVT